VTFRRLFGLRFIECQVEFLLLIEVAIGKTLPR
jgi:hypothetical protein